MDKQQKHKLKAQKQKARVDASIAKAQIEKGIFILMTGNGKGKTSSGFGCVARCIGHGYKAAVVQFIKGKWASGERTLFESLNVPFVVMGTGFTWETQDREGDIAAATKVWQQAKEFLADPDYHMVLLDELTYMLGYKYLDKQEVIEAIQQRPENQSVIVTGRGAIAELRDIADTVSDVDNVKHAYQAGIKARKGVDW